MADEKHKLSPRLNYTLSSRKFLALNQCSRAISKTRPKVRIVHVLAPDIIKTDVENFRELVQRLTGKPPPEKAVDQSKRNHALRTSSGDHETDRPKVVIGGLSRYYQELEVEEEKSSLVTIDVSRMHALKQGSSLLDLNSFS